MLVRDCMTRHPIMITPTTPAAEAHRLMATNTIRHLPVVGDGKRLLGMVTEESLRLPPEQLGSLNVWEIGRMLNNLSVKRMMVPAKSVATVSPDETAEKAARLMNEKRITGMPVIEDGVVTGIVTDTDLLDVLAEMLAFSADGVRVTVRMVDRPGEFVKLIAALAKHEIGVMGIGTYPSPKREGYYDCVIKTVGGTAETVKAALEGVSDQQITDIRTS